MTNNKRNTAPFVICCSLFVLCYLLFLDLPGQLANFEPLHLELQRAERHAQVTRGLRDVPGVPLERAQQEIPLERHQRPIEQAGVRSRPIELDHVKLERQVLVGDELVIDDGDEALDQVFELANVSGPR